MEISFTHPVVRVTPSLSPPSATTVVPSEPSAATRQTTHRKTCIHRLQSLHDLFKVYCPPVSLPTTTACYNVEALDRLEILRKSHIRFWADWVKTTTGYRLGYLAGSAARFVAGQEYLKQQFSYLAQRLPADIRNDVMGAIEDVRFPYNDVDLHFPIALSSSPHFDLDQLRRKLIGALPVGVEEFCPAVILVNKPVYGQDPAGPHVTLLKLQLHVLATGTRVDLIFEPTDQPVHLFGADDLILRLSWQSNEPLICSTNPYGYLTGQVFRVLERHDRLNGSAHRRLLLAMTQGYWADPELIHRCREQASEIPRDQREFVAAKIRDAHLPASGLARVAHQVNHQMQWEPERGGILAGGHLLTEMLNISRQRPQLARAAEALLHVIVSIALLEDHQGELSAFVRGSQIQACFPGPCSVWFPLDVRPALRVLRDVSAEDFADLRVLLHRMPQWKPAAKVTREYAQSVSLLLQSTAPLGWPEMLNDSACELVQLRLQAALAGYGGASCVKREAFWREALRTESVLHLRIQHELLASHTRPPAHTIDWIFTGLQREPAPHLARGIADWLIEHRQPRAIEFLKLIEPHPGVAWEAISTCIERGDSSASIWQRVQCERLAIMGYQAIPHTELASLIPLMDDVAVLTRLSHDLMNAADHELYTLGLEIAERIGAVNPADLRPELLSIDRLARYALAKHIPLTEAVMERLLAGPLTLKEQATLVQRYTGPNPERFWQQVTQRLTYEPGSWPDHWRQLPGVNRQAQVMWTAVVHAIQQGEITKATGICKSLVAMSVEPPGGRVALAVWLHHTGAPSSLANILGVHTDPVKLLEQSPDDVLLALQFCSGEIRWASAGFAAKAVERCLDLQQDPWSLWCRMQKRALPDALRTRWILNEEDPRRICELLPAYTLGTPILSILRKRNVIRELLADRATHPWVYALLLDGPLVDWPSRLLTTVITKLIEPGANRRQYDLIALYGEKLQNYTQIWQRVTEQMTSDGRKFTAIWLAQGVPLESISRLYIQAPSTTDNLGLLLEHCLSPDHLPCALELWRSLPCLKEREFLEFSRQLFFKVDAPDLTTWALQRLRGDEAVVKRGAELTRDASSAERCLYPALTRLKLNGKQTCIAEVIINLLPSNRIDQDMVRHLRAAGLSVASGRLLAQKCLADGLSPDTTDAAVQVLISTLETVGAWHSDVWTRIRDYYIDNNLKMNVLGECRNTLRLIIEGRWSQLALSHEDIWHVIQCYAKVARDEEEKARARTYWEDALKALPAVTRPVWISAFENIYDDSMEQLQGGREVVTRMVDQNWISSVNGALIDLVLASGELELTSDKDGLADRCIRHCERIEVLLPHFVAGSETLYPLEKSGRRKPLRLLLVCLNPLLQIALTSWKKDDQAAARVSQVCHQLLRRPLIQEWGLSLFLRDGYIKQINDIGPPFPSWWIRDLLPILELAFRENETYRHELIEFGLAVALNSDTVSDQALKRLTIYCDIICKQDVHLSNHALCYVAAMSMMAGRPPCNFLELFPTEKDRHMVLRTVADGYRIMCKDFKGSRYEFWRDRIFLVIGMALEFNDSTTESDSDLLWMAICDAVLTAAPADGKIRALTDFAELMFEKVNAPLFERIQHNPGKKQLSALDLTRNTLYIALPESARQGLVARTEVAKFAQEMLRRGWLTAPQVKNCTLKLKRHKDAK